jgi:GTP-binding protein HflX
VFERPEVGDIAVLVHIDFNYFKDTEDYTEFKTLVMSAGVYPVATVKGSRDAPDSKYFIGSGKLEEVKQALDYYKANVVIFDHSLSPAQTRNLEKMLNCRVIDRTGLILDIFAQRARSFEGKLQVELAQLNYLSTRLVRGWTHLERQKGGIGLRGPGESQLETDRRLISKRIDNINSRLEKVRNQREQNRAQRRKQAIPTVSFVGYTNAGKSTLFNQLLDAKVYASDQLFATLDPTLRQLEIADVGSVIFIDTVGFIRHLPHALVESFKATLEETTLSNLILHVIDISDPEYKAKIEQVKEVLAEINADSQPIIEVYNKIDCVYGLEPKIERGLDGTIAKIWLSAAENRGLELLKQAVAENLAVGIVQTKLQLDFNQATIRSKLYNINAVQNEEISPDQKWILSIRAPIIEVQRIFAQEDNNWQNYILN